MKTFLALVIGVAIGVAAFWVYNTNQGGTIVRDTASKLDQTAKQARTGIQEQLRTLNLTPDDIKEELARSGQVVRRKAEQAGQAIADATADARITAAIKAKLIAHKDLSAVDISVNTTAGVVTLSGAVNTREEISEAMLLVMETDGVREVISTLQLRARPATK